MTALHYPHLQIPEERFSWIYPLSTKLEPKAEIYWWEDHQQDIKDAWSFQLEGKDLQTKGDGQGLEKLSTELLNKYPRHPTFFSFLVDAYLMQNQLEHAKNAVEKRKSWMIQHPYKVIGKDWAKFGVDREKRTLRDFGYTYYLCMGDWIGAMRTIQFFEIDVQHKIETGFVFRTRK